MPHFKNIFVQQTASCPFPFLACETKNANWGDKTNDQATKSASPFRSNLFSLLCTEDFRKKIRLLHSMGPTLLMLVHECII